MTDRRRLLPYPDPVLTDGVVRLRRWEHRDLGCIRAAGDDPRIPQGTTVPPVFSDAEGLAFVERQWRRQPDGDGLSLAIARADTDAAVGLVALLFRREPAVVGLGYWVVPEERGHRFATRAVALLTPWALRRGTVNRVEAIVEVDNLASLRTLASAGFRREGLLRSYLDGTRDVVIHSVIRSDLTP